jgi:hypothetical protein
MVRMREIGGEYSIMIRCRSSPDQLVRRLSKHAQYPGPSSLTGVLGRHTQIAARSGDAIAAVQAYTVRGDR